MDPKKHKYPRIDFRISYCSGEDPQYPASELLLQSPECKGWQTQRYCSYPQNIVLELMEPMRLRHISVLSHQHKISSRIEIQHRLSKDQSFKRLGHFSPSNNQDSNFSIRQLKKIPVDIVCISLRFTINKNHVNKYNIFNQVGLISIGLFGERMEVGSYEQPAEREEMREQAEFDKNTLNRMRELENLKKKAVEDEDYMLAKSYKAQLESLKKMGSQIAELEKRKRIAVEREDYDSANLIRDQIKRIVSGGNSQVFNQPPGHKYQQQQQQQYHQEPRGPPPQQQPMTSISPVTRVDRKPPSKQPSQSKASSYPPVSHDELPIHASKKAQQPTQYPEQQQQGREPSVAEPLKGEAAKVASNYRDFYQEETFRKIFSKNFANREDGLEDVKEIVDGQIHPDKPGMVAATLAIVKSTIDDKITNVLLSSMDLLEVLMRKYNPNKQDTSGNMDYILSKLSDYQGHSNQKVKMAASQLFSQLPRFGMTNKNVCIRSLTTIDSKKPPNPKVLCGRLETLSSIIEQYKAGQNSDQCAQFAVKYVDDKSSEVRNSAMNLLRCLIEEVGYGKVTPFLKNVRAPIIKSIESMVQDEVPSNRQQIPIKPRKQQQQYEDQQPLPTTKKQPKAPPAKRQPQPQPVNQTCQFCGKSDPQLADDNYRDIHLFSICPMLVLCQCQQAIEVSSLTSHLLSECRNSKYYKRCPRCKQAIHQRNYKAHAQSKECTPAQPLAVANRCPLCHQDIGYGQEGWRKHLAQEGCPNHNRGN